jgi:uncharacterized protein GlcG (DUF336 family)
MTALTFQQARTIADGALAHAAAHGFKPLSIAVLDARGAPVVLLSQDGTPLMRWRVAMGKAQASIGLGLNSRALNQMALDRPHFISAVAEMAKDGFVPVPGGVLIRDASGAVIGAVGISGDTSDNDEAACLAGIAAAGLVGHA